MKIPLSIVIYLPKKWRDKYIQRVWDEKSDEDINDAYVNAKEWIQISNSTHFNIPITRKIAEECREKLKKFIIPQSVKRGLNLKP